MHHTPIDLARVALAVLLMLCGHAASAVELEQAVVMLEAAGDFELAETLAFKLTQKQPEHYHRINFLHKYADSEFAEIVYAQTWRDVKDSGNTAELHSFIQAMPAGAHALEALDLLFALYEQESTILGFQEYLAAFPNSPQAVKALEDSFRLAFERALTHADKLDSVAFFDEYIRTFPASPHVAKANRKAEDMEYRAIKSALDDLSLRNLFTSKQDQKEIIARKLYNEMRIWQRQSQLLIGQRKYKLLQRKLFIDTPAYTEMMDREETMIFRRAVAAFQEQTSSQLEDLHRLYEEESRRIVATIRAEAQRTRRTIAAQGEHTRRAIAVEGGQTRQGLQQVAAGIGELSYQKGRLADVVNLQTDRRLEESRRASYEQQSMFDRAQEEARHQANKSRHCAEVLTKNGKYPLFSSCP